MGIKLNLASGTDIRDGWINMDVIPRYPTARRGCDIVWDARKDSIPFTDNSIEEIYGGYLLLHLAPRHHGMVLDDIQRVLMPGGHLVLGEVDMVITMKRFLESPSDPAIYPLIWGEQGVRDSSEYLPFEEFDKHCHGFTQESLHTLLTEHKFVDIQRIKIFTDAVWYELTMVCTKA